MQTHLKINPRDISPYVLLPGDPARVDQIGTKLKKFKIIANNREFRIGLGEYKNKIITVCSTGIGCPSTAIATEELINAGAEYLIRVGTCGGAWQKNIMAGSLIIPTACVRDEGATNEYIPLGFPAIADTQITNALANSAKKLKQKYYTGINRTHDAFYGNQESILKWGKYLLDKNWKNYDTPILSSDMETSALFIVATLRGAKAGCVLAVNANPEPLRERLKGVAQKVITEQSQKISEAVIDSAIQVALDATDAL